MSTRGLPLAALGLSAALLACGTSTRGGEAEEAATPGRLDARPGNVAGGERPGVHRLAEGALLYVPEGYDPRKPAPLVVLLHGAGGEPRSSIRLLLELADDAGLVLLAPKSRDATWDVIRGGFGPDVRSIDALLRETFRRVAVDRKRLALGGFSDGASYALSLGIQNGDLFTHLIAFSPGFTAHEQRRGRPPIFVSHGKEDPVLPIDRCSRRLVPKLRREGHEVRYREFDGGHLVPRRLALEAVKWLR